MFLLYKWLLIYNFMKLKITKFDDKVAQYQHVLELAKALLTAESDLIANMGNIAAVLKESFDFHWVGFYRIQGVDLILGPFQGPLACTRIAVGSGVCGTALAQNQTIIVADVNSFKGHIACSPFSKSEIVVPVRQSGQIVAVLDIDSSEYNTFDETDRIYLEKLAALFDEFHG